MSAFCKDNTTMLFKQSPLVLVFAFITNGLAYSFFVITLPVVGRQLQLSDTNTSLILSLSALVITLVSPIWGQFCEHWGRRKVILSGMIASVVFTVLSALLIKARLENTLAVQTVFLLLLSARLLNSVFTGGLKPGGQAYIADITTQDNRAKGMGLMGAAFGIGSIMGGITAMISGSDKLLWGYGFISIMVIISSLLTLFKLPESHPSTVNNIPLTKTVLPYSQIWVFLLITLAGLTTFSLLQHIIGLTLQDKFQFSADQAIKTSGMAMMVSMLTMIITQLFIVKILDIKPQLLMLNGILFSIIAMFSAALIVMFSLPVMPLLLITMATFGLGLGLLFPGNLASLSIASGEDKQATVAGINGVSQGIGLVLGPILAIKLHNISFSMPYLACGFLLLALLALLQMKQSQASIILVEKGA